MKTKMMGLLIALFATLFTTATKAQPTINVDNQLACSIIVNLSYTGSGSCSSSGPTTINANSSMQFTPSPACGTMLTNVSCKITNAGGTLGTPATADFTNGMQTFAPASITCNGTSSGIIYNNGPNNFKVY